MKKKVLIGDDAKIVRMVLRGLIEWMDETQTIIEGWDKNSILEAYVAHRPDVILLDLDLPEVGGWETLRSIREIDPRVKVFMITASLTPEKGKKAVEFGATGFIKTPFDLPELAGALDIDYSPLSASA